MVSAEEKRKFFVGELFKYAANMYHVNKATIGVIRIIKDRYLEKTNAELFVLSCSFADRDEHCDQLAEIFSHTFKFSFIK